MGARWYFGLLRFAVGTVCSAKVLKLIWIRRCGGDARIYWITDV